MVFQLKQSVTDALVKAVNDYDTNDASKKLMDKVQENVSKKQNITQQPVGLYIIIKKRYRHVE